MAYNLGNVVSQRISHIRQLWPDFNVTEGDLKQPTAEFVLTFLEKMLEEMALLEFAREDHNLDQVLNQVSITAGSKKIVVFCTIFKHLFAKIKAPPFGIEDIIEPDPKRFGKQIDILLNLVRYLEFHFAKVFNKNMEEMDGLLNQKNHIIEEIDRLTERRNEIAIEKKEFPLQLKLVEKDKYKEILNKFEEKTLEVTAEYNEFNGIDEKNAADISALKEAIHKESDEIEHTKGNIILSPDAVHREKVELINRRKDLEKRHTTINSTIDEKNNAILQLEKLWSTMETLPGQIKDLAESQSFSKILEKGLHEDKVNCNKADDKYEAVMQDYLSREQELSNIKGEIVKLEEQYASKFASLENRLLKEKRDLQEAEEEQIKKGAEQVLAAQEIQVWQEEITSMDEEEKVVTEYFLTEKQKIENEVEQFRQKIEQLVVQKEGQLGM